jgi:hypothetical protein
MTASMSGGDGLRPTIHHRTDPGFIVGLAVSRSHICLLLAMRMWWADKQIAHLVTVES